MKYKSYNEIIPLEQRKEINKKILSIIDSNDSQGITKEDIFNSYTEKGGNHDLLFKDFDNYYDYSQKKKEIEEGQFFTPPSIIKEIYNITKPQKEYLIGDLTSGIGSFINYAPNESNFYANEIDLKAIKVSKYLYPKAHHRVGSIEYYEPNVKFDIIFGNPPFNIKIKDTVSQLYYFIKSSELLNHSGLLIVLVPLSFLRDDFKDKSQIETINKDFNFLGQYKLDKNTFENANIKTKVMFFQRKSEYLDSKPFNNIFKTKEELSDIISQVKEESLRIASKVYFENVEHSDNNYSFQNRLINKTDGYEFKLRKYLFEIKQHKFNKYQVCLQHIEKLNNQKKPENITDKQWDKKKLTKNKVLSYIKGYLKPRKIKKEKSIISIKKLNRKIDNIPYSEIEEDKKIKKFLKSKSLNEIKLNNIQLYHTNIFCQKRYSVVNFGMGSGKSLISLYTHLYRKKFNNIKNTFIIAPALAINGNWNIILKEYKLSYTKIKKLVDIDSIKENDIVIITSHYLSKYKRQLKKFIRNKKIFTIIDESDMMSNVNSQISKNLHNVFKHSYYKMLLTGTFTRNNITEAFSQLSFLYGSSNNFINDNHYIYVENRKTKKIERTSNLKVNEPFRMYKKGLTEFSRCYNPKKSTVFGIGKLDQDVYNYDSLKNIISYSIVTKSLEDIIGNKIFKYHQVLCNFNYQEIELYKKIVNEFHNIRYRYFHRLENSRKDGMFAILQQLNLLLKASATPHTFHEVTNKWSVKFDKVNSLVEKMNNERIAIGVIRVNSVEEYKNYFTEKYPNRNVFTIVGDVSFERRLSIINELEKTKNGILIFTQQSMSTSINVDFVDKIIIPEMNWNLSSVNQAIFRFIRYTSTKQKDIYFVSYANSIESNLLQLLVTKEKLVNIMKSDSSLTEYDEINEELGIDFDILDMLMSKETDEDGKTQINVNWGNQKIN